MTDGMYPLIPHKAEQSRMASRFRAIAAKEQ